MNTEVLPSDHATCIAFAFDERLDHEQVTEMARVVDDAITAGEDLRLLLDLRDTRTFAVGAFVSPHGFLASIRSVGPVTRYAVVGAPAMVGVAVEAFGAILPLKSRAFAPEAIAEARRWVCAPVT
ncbi:MAG: hypothetical protein GC147_07890 [Porphyrobacter sp.]|nr:hypothetical protein [Porphyrobacter sp.]